MTQTNRTPIQERLARALADGLTQARTADAALLLPSPHTRLPRPFRLSLPFSPPCMRGGAGGGVLIRAGGGVLVSSFQH